MFRLPPLNFLRAFEAAARHLSFTKAAEELNCTQASVSQQIRALEQFIGRPLFQRLPRGLSLTEAGYAYLPAVQASIQHLFAATNGLMGPPRTQNLVISVPMAFAAYWLAPRIKQFCALHSHINVTVHCTIWNLPDLETADLFVRLGNGDWREMQAKQLTREQAVVACSPDLLRGPNALRKPADIRGYPLIHVLGRHDNWSRWAAAQNVADLGSGHAIWADNSVTALQIAGSGYGLALTLRTFVNFFAESKTVVCPFKEALDLEQGYFILRPTNRHSSSAAKAFMDWIPELE